MEARDSRQLSRLQAQLASVKLLIIDELGYVPLSPTGAELLFEVFSQRYERGATIVTSNLPFVEWTSVLGSERLTGALLDRLTHHVHILEMNGESYRLKQARDRRRKAIKTDTDVPAAEVTTVDPETGEVTSDYRRSTPPSPPSSRKNAKARRPPRGGLRASLAAAVSGSLFRRRAGSRSLRR
jgi:hypothetical protein